MSTPIALSDEQLTAVLRACDPLLPSDRDPFLRALAALLASESQQPPGDGAVFRAIKSLQRGFFRPPTATAGPQSHRTVGPPIE